jgi:4-amino-4-deoxy-L-arabinose transferase-like glycosyltransferase
MISKGNQPEPQLWLCRPSLILAVITSCLIVGLALRRTYDHDEFEAIKSAWKIFHGERIYVDFFQHHHPLLYYLLLPLFALFGEGNAIIVGARLLMLPFVAGIFVLTWSIACLIYGRTVAALAVLFLALTPLFVNPAIEVRPDVPQVFFGLLSVHLLYRYLEKRAVLQLVLSGVALGVAFLFLQKALLLVAGLALVIAGRLWRRELTVRELGIFSVAAALPPLAYVAYTLLRGDWNAYFFFNFRFNATGRRQSLEQFDYLIQVLAAVNPLVLLGFLSALFVVPKTVAQREMAMLAVSLGALVLLNGVHYRQYYLAVMPFLVMVAAQGFVQILCADRRIAGIALALVAVSGLSGYLLAISTGNGDQLDRIEYVRALSGPDDYVYDGDIQFNLFRKDLDFFWFSVQPGGGLDNYRSFQPYHYDVLDLIKRRRPAVISNTDIPELRDPRIRNYYMRSAYPGLYIRRKD